MKPKFIIKNIRHPRVYYLSKSKAHSLDLRWVDEIDSVFGYQFNSEEEAIIFINAAITNGKLKDSIISIEKIFICAREDTKNET